MRGQYRNVDIMELYLMPYEIKGLERIEKISQMLFKTQG